MKTVYQKIILVFTIIISMSFSLYTSANFKDQLYCSIENNTMIVSLKKKSNYLCKNYILYAKSAIYKQYGEIQKINAIISETDNIEYRVSIRKKKEETILKLNGFIKKIHYNTEKFEKNLTDTVQKYLIKTIDKERSYLHKIQMNISLIKADSPRIRELNTNLENGQKELNNIQNTDNMDVMLEALKKYIYIKRSLTGTSES